MYKEFKKKRNPDLENRWILVELQGGVVKVEMSTENDYNFKVDIEESWELKVFISFLY